MMIVERRHIKSRERAVESRKTPRFDIRSIREEVQMASYFSRKLNDSEQRRVAGRKLLHPHLIVKN